MATQHNTKRLIMPPYDEYDYKQSNPVFSGINMVREIIIGDSIVKSKIRVDIPLISLDELENGIPKDIIDQVHPLVKNGFRPEGFVQ